MYSSEIKKLLSSSSIIQKMTIIVFLIDTSASMLQKTYLGTTYLDYARLAVEQFLKLRQRDSSASNGDRYMLMTFEEYPQNIKSGWKESQRVFNEQLKSLKARGSLNFESSLESVIRLLTVSRMQSGSGASIETYGFGRYPSYAEHVVIIPVVDGSSLPSANPDARIPKPHLLNGTELYAEAFRWDQRLFPIVLRLPGQLQPDLLQQQGIVPQEDQSIAQSYAEQMGGRSFSIQLHRSLGPSIDQIIQRIQSNGVLVRFQKHGPDPPLPSTTAENEQPKENGNSSNNDDLSWRNCLVLLKKIGSSHSSWQIPEAYWPESVRSSLPQRTAHPLVAFKCEKVEALFNTELQLDKYEIDASSALVQYILGRRDQSLCWQVFVENSSKQPGPGFPFGYIKISTSSMVTLYLMPYNYPELLALLQTSKEPKVMNSLQFQQKFEKYLSTVPAYYFPTLKKSLGRIKALPPAMEEQSKRLYAYCNLGTLQTRIKNQGQKEFELACSAVYKSLQEPVISNPALVVKVSRSRAQLSKESLTACTFRPAVAPYKALIPADAFKESSIFLLETSSQSAAIPSLQFKNPFDIPRLNLCAQLDKMRLNFDQQVQTNNLHVLEGGMPGQKIKLQHAEDLHNLPITKMGSYEEYMKSMSAIGLGPRRELEPQTARPHAFGNPFKLDKKNMSVVDEVGEVNAAAGTSSEGSAGGNERRERKRDRAASEGPSAVGRPKRKQGPVDPNRLAIWKRRRHASSGLDDTASSLLSANFNDTQSAPGAMADFDEERRMEDEEEEGAQGEEQFEDGDRAAAFEEHLQQLSSPFVDESSLGGEIGDGMDLLEMGQRNEAENGPGGMAPGQGREGEEGEGFFHPCHPSTSEPMSAPIPSSATKSAVTKRKRKRHQQMGGPVISPEQFLQKQRQIRSLIRQIGLRNEQLHGQLMEIVTDRTLPRERLRQLLELGQREAREFKRHKLVAMLSSSLADDPSSPTGIRRPGGKTRLQPMLKQNGFNK